MRLWHKDLISVLPRKQLQGQWRELLAIKGAICKNGVPNHILINKVINYSINEFKQYSLMVYTEGRKRRIKFNKSKLKDILNWGSEPFKKPKILFEGWHNDRYLLQCFYNLQEKYDCGGISKEEWEVIENKFNEITNTKNALDNVLDNAWNEFINCTSKKYFKEGGCK